MAALVLVLPVVWMLKMDTTMATGMQVGHGDSWVQALMPALVRASPPMEPTVQRNGHVCATCGAVTGSPNEEPKLSRSRLKLGLASSSLAVGLFCGSPVFPQMHYRESP